MREYETRLGSESRRWRDEDNRWQLWSAAFKWNALIGAGEWVRCKARWSVGPETYVAGYFEDHARLRTQQIARYRAPPQL